MSQPRHALVVPVLNHFRGACELLASIDLSCSIYLQPQWRDRVSVAEAWNRGIAKAILDGHQYVHVVNDDVVLHPDCLWLMARAFEDIENERGVRPVLVSGCEPPREAAYGWATRATYACFTVDEQFFRRVPGGFDEEYYPAYFEDDDMKYRLDLLAKKSGVPAVDHRAPEAYYDHARSQTRANDPDCVSDKQFQTNRARYMMKWGGSPGNERFTRAFDMPEEEGTP